MKHLRGLTPVLRNEIVRRIRSVHEPRRVIMFGSAARGELTRNSDIDLLVLEDQAPDARARSVRICDVLRGLGRPFDVVVMETSAYEESREVFGGLAYPASREGQVLYEAG